MFQVVSLHIPHMHSTLQTLMQGVGEAAWHRARRYWVVHGQDFQWGNGPRANFGCQFFVGAGWHDLHHVHHLCDLQL